MTQPTQAQREADLTRGALVHALAAALHHSHWIDEEVCEQQLSPPFERVSLMKGGQHLRCAVNRVKRQILDRWPQERPADGARAVDAEWCEANGAALNGDVYFWSCGYGVNVEWGRNTGAAFVLKASGICPEVMIPKATRAQVRHLLAAFNQGEHDV